MQCNKLVSHFAEMLSSLWSRRAVPGSKERFAGAYLIAWLIYSGLLIGGAVHQRIFYGNFDLAECGQIIFFSLTAVLFEILFGAVIATALDFSTALLLPSILEPKNIVRTSAIIFPLCIAVGFAISRGDVSVDQGCF